MNRFRYIEKPKAKPPYPAEGVRFKMKPEWVGPVIGWQNTGTHCYVTDIVLSWDGNKVDYQYMQGHVPVTQRYQMSFREYYRYYEPV